jgi:signal transduction histidine kinase
VIKTRYQNHKDNITNKIKILIENKKEVISFIALSLSNDQNIIKAIKSNDNSSIKLDKFSKKLKETTPYENVWFQIIDKNGKSFYRSWTPKSGDSMLTIREDIVKMIQTPTNMSTISTGKYAMSFKSMIPIYDNNEFLGIFEIITHFNSLYHKLKQENVETIYIVDKSYKKQITKPYYPLFIGDYYVSMDTPDKNIIQILETNGLEKYINNKNYMIDKKNEYITTTYPIFDIDNNTMGYIITFKKTSAFTMNEVSYIQHNIITTFLILVLLIILVGYYFFNKRYEMILFEQHKEHEKDVERNTKFLTIGQMAAGITHEINTPLTYIKGTNEMSKFDIDDMPSSELKTRLLLDNKKIADGVNRISNIVESMREMSQVTSSVKENANLYSTLITTLRLINNRSKHISKIYINDELFDIETADKEKYEFFTLINKQKIEQVWTIIINNALDELVKIDDYEKRKLAINITSYKNTIKITFQDNAGGINEDIMDDIFEPFISTKLSHGIGIGLNVAKKILDEHGVKIEIKNQNGGALFEVVFQTTKASQ